MNSIDYPFAYDGSFYAASLASGCLAPSFWAGVKEIWQMQAPFFFIFELAVCRTFGFSYPNILLGQSVLLAFLFCVNFFVALRVMTYSGLQLSVGAKSRLFLILLSVVASLGVLHVMPGNLFDFRMDLVGSLLLSAALQSIVLRNGTTVLLVAIAICERFHNMAILGGATIVWLSADIIRARIRGEGISPFRIAFQSGWAPALGVALLCAIRGPQMLVLMDYYLVGHFGETEKTLRGFGGWSSPGYLSFYPRALLREYLVWPGMAGLTGMAFWLKRRPRGFATRLNALQNARPLLFGAGCAFLLLTIDPTRNNTGVLRYALIPFGVWLGSFFFTFTERSDTELCAKNLMVAFVCVMSLGGASGRLFSFYRDFDYFGIRARPILPQLEPIFVRFCARISSKNPRGIKVAANFNTDLNLNPGQWKMYLAAHRLPKAEYDFPVGGLFHADDFKKQILDKLTGLDFFIDGNRGCRRWSDTPFNREVDENFERFSAAVAQSTCTQVVGTVILDSCTITVKECVQPR